MEKRVGVDTSEVQGYFDRRMQEHRKALAEQNTPHKPFVELEQLQAKVKLYEGALKAIATLEIDCAKCNNSKTHFANWTYTMIETAKAALAEGITP